MDETLEKLNQQFLRQITHWQEQTHQIQQDLLSMYEQKQAALVRRDFVLVESLLSQEQDLLQRYSQAHQQRETLLSYLMRLDPQVTILTSWLNSLPISEVITTIKQGLTQIATGNQRLQQRCWAMWIVANRNAQCFGEMVELITYAGKRAPTYDEVISSRVSGSSFLDASA